MARKSRLFCVELGIRFEPGTVRNKTFESIIAVRYYIVELIQPHLRILEPRRAGRKSAVVAGCLTHSQLKSS
jgi:hypothetical protein